jgi:hypothetical protein
MFVFGKDMVVRGNSGPPQIATRASSLITVSFGQAAAAAVLVPTGAMNGPLAKLEGKPTPSGNPGRGSGGGSGTNADQSLSSSGFSAVNSNQAPRIIAPGIPDNFGSGPGPRNRNASEAIATVLTNANQGVQQQFAVQDQRQQQAIQQQQAAVVPPVVPLPEPPNAQGPTTTPVGPLPGQPPGPQPTNLPTTGTVTYVGNMYGAANGRLAGGDYSNAWNFNTRSGNFTATFDGARFQGTTVQNGNSVTYNTRGPVGSSNTNRQLELNGAFYGRGSQPQYQFGFFNVQGPRYSGNGVYLGEKR